MKKEKFFVNYFDEITNHFKFHLENNSRLISISKLLKKLAQKKKKRLYL